MSGCLDDMSAGVQNGEFIIAVDPNAFSADSSFVSRIESLVENIAAGPNHTHPSPIHDLMFGVPIDEAETRLPGDRRYANREETLANGGYVNVHESLYAIAKEAAEQQM